MRRLLPFLTFVLVFALMTGVASAQKKQPPNSNIQPAAAVDCTVGPNIVMDCNFAAPMFPPFWNNTGDTSFSSVVAGCGVHPGSTAVNCAQMGPIFYLGQLTQILNTNPGQNYTLSFWVFSDGRPSDFEVWWGGVDPGTLNPANNFQSKVSNPPDFPYTQFTYQVTASATTTPLTFVFYNVPSWVRLTDVAVF